MAREDFVKCVSLPGGLGGGSWCGRPKNCFEWRFLDVEHAALTRRNAGRQLVRPQCRAAVISALESER